MKNVEQLGTLKPIRAMLDSNRLTLLHVVSVRSLAQVTGYCGKL